MRTNELRCQPPPSGAIVVSLFFLPGAREESRGGKEKAVTENSPQILGRKSNAVFEPTQTHQGESTAVAG